MWFFSNTMIYPQNFEDLLHCLLAFSVCFREFNIFLIPSSLGNQIFISGNLQDPFFFSGVWKFYNVHLHTFDGYSWFAGADILFTLFHPAPSPKRLASVDGISELSCLCLLFGFRQWVASADDQGAGEDKVRVFISPVSSLWYYELAVTASPLLQLLISPGSSNHFPSFPFRPGSGDSFPWLLAWGALSCLADFPYHAKSVLKVPLPIYAIWVCHSVSYQDPSLFGLSCLFHVLGTGALLTRNLSLSSLGNVL